MRRVLERLNNICLFIFSSCHLDGLIDAALPRQNVEHVGIFPLLDLFWQPSEFLWCEPLLLSSAFSRPLSHVFVIADVFFPPRGTSSFGCVIVFVTFWLIEVTRAWWSVRLLGQKIRLKRCEVSWTLSLLSLPCQKVQRESCLSGLWYFPADTQGGNQMRRAFGRDG